ncbi:hypothetical protein F5Y19DRAFT_440737 [Xylariaceae sp. FL1651]|nr:hypothetical protein F5Y19DRAFT_440737 [Xylariaceae sp. FL1651]
MKLLIAGLCVPYKSGQPSQPSRNGIQQRPPTHISPSHRYPDTNQATSDQHYKFSLIACSLHCIHIAPSLDTVLARQGGGGYTLEIMPSNTIQTNDLYYEVPVALAPFISSTLLLMKLYNWQRSQYYQLLNLVDTTMEQTSSLMTKLQGATGFTKFNDLPPEIRIKIWQYAMPEERTVVIKSPYVRHREIPTSLEGALPQSFDEETWQSTTQVPALLHVNAEARHEALKHYTLSLGVGKVQPRVYIDFNRDTIFFGNSELKPECSSLWAETKDLNKVQRLAVVPEGAWRVLRWKKVDLNSLQKMIFVHDTDKVKLGPWPQLVEDRQSETDMSLETELEQQIQLLEDVAMDGPQSTALDSPMKKRMQAAREELDTLMMVLPTQWEKEPVVSTAVFQKTRGDRWVC